MTMEASERKHILDALHSIQDADGVLCMGGPTQPEHISTAMQHHRSAIKHLLQALGMWTGEVAS